MKSNTLEIIMGAVVLIGAAFFLSLIYKAADLKTSEGYVITAEFGNTGGLKIGDDVRVSGIKVGKIISQSLNENTFNAQINMRIDNKIKLPIDRFEVSVTKGARIEPSPTEHSSNVTTLEALTVQ